MSDTALLWLDAGELRGHRWDPGYWDPALRDPLAGCPHPLAELGEFIAEGDIAYGRIRPGRRPPEGDGPRYVTQRAVRPTGVDLSACARIVAGCPWDGERQRLRRGDLVIPRSGVATLARGVMTIFLDDEPAVVDCFTDRVTLTGYDPRLATLFLRSRPGWLQILRQINGVGPPNLSFDEIRRLRVPLLDGDAVARIRARYDQVDGAHRAWLGRRDALRAAGRDPDADPDALALLRRAGRTLRRSVAHVEAVVLPD